MIAPNDRSNPNLHPQHLIDQVVSGHCRDPFGFLGMHKTGDGFLTVRAFLPGASQVELLRRDNRQVIAPMDLVHDWGFFATSALNETEYFPYLIRARFDTGTVDLEDPYRFWSILGEIDAYLFREGRHWELYKRLGSHPKTLDGVRGTLFAVWAPNASRVSVVGPFNSWDGRRHPMRLRVECGIWELFLPMVQPGDLYKYEIKGPGGETLPLKSDPYGQVCEAPPGNASVVPHPVTHQWGDQGWMDRRRSHDIYHAPMSIYECHLGSWRRVPEDGNRYLTYREMADQLVPYVKALGFTHVEMLPVSEHPFDPSWGYQPICMFAPTHRFGLQDDFRYLVDRFHQEGIGVIMDWVPGHFPTDPHGLGRFDGSALYEHEDLRQGFHPDWNTLIYNYGRAEVSNYLIANALYWIKEFHLDGLRVDAVASMLYNDYSRQEGQWIPNRYGGNENLEAIDFLRLLNKEVYAQGGGAITIAEESTSWGMVSRPVDLGGLGFGFKWNMGWMHDTLEFMRKEPIHRRYHHNKLTFGMLYAYHENFLLPLSHDEVVHGKRSLLDQMPGDAWQKFANLRAYFTFMYAFPGKKLLFMGGEFGQGREWNHEQSLDWHLLNDVPLHQGIWKTMRDLNHLYKNHPALHQLDHEPGGFEWIDCHDHDQSVISWLRKGRDAGLLLVVCNFTPVPRVGYRIGAPLPGTYEELFNSDSAQYQGSNMGNGGSVTAEEVPHHGRPYSISLTLPPLAALVLEPREIPDGFFTPPPAENDSSPEAAGDQAPAVPLDQAVRKDGVVCLLCGKEFKSLPVHLARTHKLDVDAYRNRFGLSEDFPMEVKPQPEKKRKK
ncbi:MAG: 1,4-alpha-glucan branching protein GlgB [Magnetococcales bacterium]|nr:1,4-alpha-glucan branching protein GlgB [Magnetococcales bacterium]